jgi:nicotinate-nucleotide--dimethylbenzimidazole phosphoribosyltransferase
MKILDETVSSIVPQDASWVKRGRQRLDQLAMPHWALGRLMDLAVDLAGMTRSLKPVVRRKVIVIMAADHGVVDEGVSKYPRDVTWQMVENFVRGGAGINALASQAGADVCVVDMGVAKAMGELAGSGSILSMPVAEATANIARGPAMTRDQAVSSIENGIRVARRMIGEDGYDLIGVGEMGIGNTTPSSAIIAVFSGAPVSETTGPGTGIDDGQIRHKIKVIERAIQATRPDPEDGLDVLTKIGGFEIGGIAGLILGAAAQKRPVIVDGLISTAGALIAQSLVPASVDYMIAAHRSAEKGHILALRGLGKEPLLDLGLRLGEGTGAALAMNLVEAAVRILTDVSTFSEAGVSGAVG